MKYYNIYFNESQELGTGQCRSERVLFLPERGPVQDWVAPVLDLIQGGFPDYLASDLGVRLCSEKMRNILAHSASTSDLLQWLPVKVFHGAESRNYWVLHFPEPVDALGKTTIWQGEFVVKPVLCESRLERHSVLTYPGAEGVALLVNEVVKNALGDASCTGFECSPAAVEP